MWFNSQGQRILILHVSRGKDGEEVVKTPNGEFFLARDAVSATSHGGVLEHVDGDLAKQGEILGAVLPGDFASVLAKGNVEHPVQLVLDVPVATYQSAHAFRLDEHQRLETWPLLGVVKPIHFTLHPNASVLVASMSLVGCRMECVWGFGELSACHIIEGVEHFAM